MFSFVTEKMWLLKLVLLSLCFTLAPVEAAPTSKIGKASKKTKRERKKTERERYFSKEKTFKEAKKNYLREVRDILKAREGEQNDRLDFKLVDGKLIHETQLSPNGTPKKFTVNVVLSLHGYILDDMNEQKNTKHF